MSKQLSIVEVLYSHNIYPAFLKEDQFDSIQAAIKEILKQYTEIVVENADIIKIDGPVDEESIRNCLKLVKYE
jgi:hypothetical protein